MNKLRAAITAVGGYVPETKLTNSDLEKTLDTSDEWITTRTGIKERRILKTPNSASSDLGVEAVKDLLRKKNLDPMEIDCVICATVTPDVICPATANIISYRVGAKNAWSFDLEAACSGFLYALTVGANLIESGRYKKVVVVGADKLSAFVDYTDRTTCILFGDGAGAVLLEPNGDGYGLYDAILKSDGSGWDYLGIKAGGSRYPSSVETINSKMHYVYQDGKQVFKRAVVGMADVAQELLNKNHLTGDDIDWLAPHQANLRIIEATRERINLPKEKVMLNIQRYGNTTTATIPLCLWEWEKRLKKGNNLILTAFGGGFTWGAAYIKWAYDA